MATAILPADFQDRLVAFDGVSALPARAVCLGLHELVVSKLVAMREKDFEFSFALLKAGPVDVDVLLDRARLDPDE